MKPGSPFAGFATLVIWAKFLHSICPSRNAILPPVGLDPFRCAERTIEPPAAEISRYFRPLDKLFRKMVASAMISVSETPQPGLGVVVLVTALKLVSTASARDPGYIQMYPVT